ncbi:hypothetical protein MHBO_003833, partial [Bonamia ostreae]
KKRVKPRKRMKPLFWNKIVLSKEELDKKEVIWAKMEEVKINKKAFENLFCIKKKNARGKNKKSKTKKDKEDDTSGIKCVLGGKKSNAVGIMLSSLPDLSVLPDILLEMDDLMLNETQINGMLNNLPTKEEIKKITEADKPGTNWDKPEKYFLLLIKIPNYEFRLKTWIFELRFDNNVNYIQTQFDKQINGCKVL